MIDRKTLDYIETRLKENLRRLEQEERMESTTATFHDEWVPVVKGKGPKKIPALTIRRGADFCAAYMNPPLFQALGRPSRVSFDVSRDGRKVRISPTATNKDGFAVSNSRSTSSTSLGDAIGIRMDEKLVCQAEVVSRDATGLLPYAIATLPDKR